MTNSIYAIKLTIKARNDLDEIYNYIANELFAVKAANDLINKIESKIICLKIFPFSGSHVIDEILKNSGYRKLVVDNYIVIYKVFEKRKQVILMRIFHETQNYYDFL